MEDSMNRTAPTAPTPDPEEREAQLVDALVNTLLAGFEQAILDAIAAHAPDFRALAGGQDSPARAEAQAQVLSEAVDSAADVLVSGGIGLYDLLTEAGV